MKENQPITIRLSLDNDGGRNFGAITRLMIILHKVLFYFIKNWKNERWLRFVMEITTMYNKKKVTTPLDNITNYG